MAVLTSVGISSGVPNSGSGTASTLDGVFNTTAGPAILTTTTATAGAVAIPVTLSPNGINANGQAPMASSAPVVISSDQSPVQVLESKRTNKGQNMITLSTTGETTLVTAAVGNFLDVYGIIVTNTAATAANVTFKDSTSGTTRFVIEAVATDTRGFMLSESAAITQAATNTNWTATISAGVSSINITALYVKN